MFSGLFYLSHYILNDFILLFLNLIIEILLVLHIKRDLKIKVTNKLNNTNFDSDIEKAKLVEELKKKKSVEVKVNTLVITSLAIYIFGRMPELIGVFYFYFEAAFIGDDDKCTRDVFCYLLYNTIEYVYVIFYLFNILIYYKFNSNFKKGLRNLFRLKPRSAKKK